MQSTDQCHFSWCGSFYVETLCWNTSSYSGCVLKLANICNVSGTPFSELGWERNLIYTGAKVARHCDVSEIVPGHLLLKRFPRFSRTGHWPVSFLQKLPRDSFDCWKKVLDRYWKKWLPRLELEISGSTVLKPLGMVPKPLLPGPVRRNTSVRYYMYRPYTVFGNDINFDGWEIYGRHEYVSPVCVYDVLILLDGIYLTPYWDVVRSKKV